ncbi:MAG: zinc ABC transporter substrate-binding protein [Rhodocyclaceae bacterium]
MKSIRILIAALAAVLLVPAHAALNVLATVPEWAALAQEIGGDGVKVYIATAAQQDPHRIEAKPSLIAQARKADLVVATGAELEIGWLPLVLRQSGNARVQPGTPGYFEAAQQVTMLEVPQRLDRAEGDVHAGGNPHIQLDPRNILRVGEGLAKRMAELDPASATAFQARWKSFSERWRAAVARWEKDAAPLRGVPVLVQHKAFPYLIGWLGMTEVGALEPKPGVEPAPGHLEALLTGQKQRPARFILRAAYNDPRASEWLAERAHIPAVALPFTVGGSEGARDLFGLFDDTVKRLLQAAKP